MTRRVEQYLPEIALLFLTLLLFLLRLSILARLDLSPDEAYYWSWSRNLSLIYPDHPPMVSWLIRLGTELLGDSSLGVRFFAVLGSVVMVPIVYRIALDAGLEKRDAAIAAGLASILVAPATAALIMTPDTPLGIAWLVAVLALVKLARRGGRSGWYLLGCAFGFGILSKHTAALIPVMAVTASRRSPRLNRGVRTIHPVIGMALAAAIAGPYLLAEFSGGLESVAFQARHLTGALGAGAGNGITGITGNILALVSGQIGLLTPVVAGWVVVACCRHIGKNITSTLVWALLIPIAATLPTAVFTHPEQNWASLGHPVAAILAVLYWRQQGAQKSPARREGWMAAMIISAAILSLLVHIHAIHPFLPLPPDRDPVSRLHGWRDLQRLRQYLSKADAIVADNYGLASEIRWVLKDLPDVPEVVSSDRQALPNAGTWLLLDEEGDWGREDLNVSCERIDRLPLLTNARKDGVSIRAIRVFIGTRCEPEGRPRLVL